MVAGASVATPQQTPVRLHVVPSRAFAWWGAGLALAVFATRWPLRSRYLFSWDAANFAYALDRYNVAFHQPHPPGYPLYVATAWLVRPLFGDANDAFVALSLVASSAGAVLLLGLAWRLFGPRVAALATALFVASPNAWGHADVAYPYALLALGATAIAWCAAETRWGRHNCALLGGLVLGVAGGFRPDLLLFLLPAWVYGATPRGWRELVGSLVLLSAVVASWLVPMVALSGGWAAYWDATSAYGTFWATPTDGGLVSFLLGLKTNLSELGRYAWRSLGPIWAPILIGTLGWWGWRRGAPLADGRMRLLLLWLLPPLGFYSMVHVGNLGYLLVVLPAAAMVAANALVRVPVAIVRSRLLANTGLGSLLPEGVTGLACLTEVLLFLVVPGPVSLPEIRAVDARLQLRLEYLAGLSPDRTLVLAYDRYRQLAYYLPAFDRRQRIQSVEELLGPDVRVNNRREVAVPPGVNRVVLADLGTDRATRPTGLRRVVLAPDVWMYEALVTPGEQVRLGYHYCRIIAAP